MQFYKSEIYHKRWSPQEHTFSYRGLYFSFWLDEEGKGALPFFSWEGFNLFSFYRKDHGNRDGSSLYEWASSLLGEAGIESFSGRIKLVTMPRLLGYVFNPVSFWYCYEGDECLAVICEVNNTFGESHNYIVKNPQENKDTTMEKVFHVSPFYPNKGTYQFNLAESDFIGIRYESDQGKFFASLKGYEYNDSLLALFFKNPFFTMFVVWAIHYQALRLYMKKAKFFKKPRPPANHWSTY